MCIAFTLKKRDVTDDDDNDNDKDLYLSVTSTILWMNFQGT